MPFLICVVEPKSKRQPVRLRHRIEKASAQKQKKAKKLAKKVLQLAPMPLYGTNISLEPGMALQGKEGSWNSKPVPVQRQDSRRG